jgi:benzoyl-CoA reductase/2-hydroxyglutaryl-CoA dehydratase subunit BcrC/BadD/HgdB
MSVTVLEKPTTREEDEREITERLRDIPEELKQRIEEGKKQLAAGQGIPFDVVIKKMRQRFQCER